MTNVRRLGSAVTDTQTNATPITHARGADFLTHLQEVGADRAKRWHPTPEQEFTGLEWAGAMCGEAGEAANVAKKLRRLELAIAGNEASERPALPPELIAKLGRELADTLIYMVNVASHYGINLADVTVEAFNNKSIEMGFPERITRTPTGRVESDSLDGFVRAAITEAIDQTARALGHELLPGELGEKHEAIVQRSLQVAFLISLPPSVPCLQCGVMRTPENAAGIDCPSTTAYSAHVWQDGRHYFTPSDGVVQTAGREVTP